MKTTDFIRTILDLIDSMETNTEHVVDYKPEQEYSDEKLQYSNSPDEEVTPMDTIFSIGDDLNKPKHPADIRVSTVALYPDAAYKGK
jgi:hypothetical protein